MQALLERQGGIPCAGVGVAMSFISYAGTDWSLPAPLQSEQDAPAPF